MAVDPKRGPRENPLMKASDDLRSDLRRINGKGYKAYKDIRGAYRFPQYQLFIDHVQGDPFASPSRVRARVDRKLAGFGPDTTSNPSRIVAICDYLTRQFHWSCMRLARGNRGTGKSGLITIDRPVQEILERSSMVINDRFVEARFFVGLPAKGRRISGRDAEAMLCEELPAIVDASLLEKNLDLQALLGHITSSEDADILRAKLDQLGLVAFVADGALLPRASGIDPGPLAQGSAIRFRSPESLRVDVALPNRGKVSGMGIPRGVTLIVGGGYHGKSTLLNAIELGIYNHVPGDGRELVVTVPEAMKIRAADGRSIVRTDISPFINNLPFGRETSAFSTENASGSTSQAANIAEAIEAGATVLLLDEDTSATNFMIRDHRMQQLVSKDKEPITPFIDKVRNAYEDRGVSTILVMGGSGDYFSVADQVIQMTDYSPLDVTERAHAIAQTGDADRLQEGGEGFGEITSRIPLPDSFNPFRRGDRLKISVPRLREIIFGRTSIDLWDVGQIVDISQTRAIGHAIFYATRYMDGKKTLAEVTRLVEENIDREGLDALVPFLTGDLARFRGIELAASINRMRTLRMKQKS